MLRLYRGYNILMVLNRKLSPQFINPFKVIKRVDKLVYRLKLFLYYKIYDVVSIVHFEFILDPVTDLYHRRSLPLSPVTVDSEEGYYKINKLLTKRKRR